MRAQGVLATASVVVGAAVVLAAPRAAWGGGGVSVGLDGGASFVDPDIELVDPTVTAENAIPTVALGIHAGGYYLFNPEIGLGFALDPAFYAAGQQPSGGINFALGPMFVWRPEWFHLVANAAFVLSAFDDRCDAGDPEVADCPQTRESVAAAPGFGLGLAPLFRLHTWQEIDLLLGPAFRYQFARYHYEEGAGGFDLHVFQAVLAVRLFVDISE